MGSVIDISAAKSVRSVPKITGVHPVGSQLLVELLTNQEMMGTSFTVREEVDTGMTPQAYILEVGTGLPVTVNLKAGDRVVVQGRGVPVPNYDNSHRPKMLIEYSMVKATLDEQTCCRGTSKPSSTDELPTAHCCNS